MQMVIARGEKLAMPGFLPDEKVVVDNPTTVPRVGEGVCWGGGPVYIVRLVVYDYDTQTIWVAVGEKK
jgi:hypothetical protein